MGNLIKFLFYVGSKRKVNHIGKMLDKEIVDHHSYICRKQLVFFCSCYFCIFSFGYIILLKRQFSVFSFFTFPEFLYHIASLLDGRYRGCISRWSADAHFFQLFHQTCFCVACRRPAEPFTRSHIIQSQALPDFQGRQHSFLLLIAILIISRFYIYLKESLKSDHFPTSSQRLRHSRNSNGSSCLFQLGIRHLRSDGPFPNQLIKPLFIIISSTCLLHAEVCWPDGFVSFLCRGRFGFKHTLMHKFTTISCCYCICSTSYGFLR